MKHMNLKIVLGASTLHLPVEIFSGSEVEALKELSDFLDPNNTAISFELEEIQSGY